MATAFLLAGSLEEIPLPDIARLFQSTRKTGRLSLVSGSSFGFMYFDRGDIVDCQATNMAGLDALKHIALFNRGTFDFKDGMTPPSHTLSTYATSELINFLETRMQESRQLQELMPSEADIPRYQGGAIPAGLEVSAADLSVALKASSGNLSVRRLAIELNLDETMVRYVIARFRAAGLIEIVGQDDDLPALPRRPPELPPPSAPTAQSPEAPAGTSDSSAPSTQPRYWRGRRID